MWSGVYWDSQAQQYVFTVATTSLNLPKPLPITQQIAEIGMVVQAHPDKYLTLLTRAGPSAFSASSIALKIAVLLKSSLANVAAATILEMYEH